VVFLLHFPAASVRGVLILVLACLATFGCKSSSSSNPIPARDAPLAQETYPAVQKPVSDSLAAALATPAEAPPASPKPLEVLAMSAGVAAAPYAAGVLVGWSESGTRPTFDVVTGISSGALLGAYAFLGPKYDPALERLIRTLTSADLVDVRPVRYFFRSGSFGSSAPAERLLRTEINDEFLADLRKAHAEGRRLFIGTTDLETKQLVIWDMGAIASSGRPDAGDLVRKVLLAAIAWPGLVPPVDFNVEVNGHSYREQHFDGGAGAMAFVRFGPLAKWPAPDVTARHGWLKGSNLYVFACRKLYSDPTEAPTGAVSRTLAFLGATFESLTRADIAQLHSLCAASGMRFQLLIMPKEIREETLGMSNMFPKEASQLFDLGHQAGVGGPHWRLTPPGAEPGEEAVPRDATGIEICP
jgi:hypothetical protein